MVELDLIVTAGLGDNSYLLTSGDEAAVIDPQRDVDRYLELAKEHGASIRYSVETHVHNDYVSGGVELRARTGAEILGPAGGRYGFRVRPMAEGDELRFGDVRLRAIGTPGHTPEHVSYLVYGAGSDSPDAVLTGGSLMVGGAGRTDLLGQALTDELTRAQFRSLRRLAALPDTVQVLPTHGAGSFCGAGPGPRERVSTMAEERIRNLALAAPDEDAFVRQQLSGLLAYPDYYRSMAPINRAGPRMLSEIPAPMALGPGEVLERMAAGVTVVDARWRGQFARAHLPGSINVELDDTFGSYVGWVVPFNAPLVLVLPEPEDESLAQAVTQLHRIGYEQIEGHLDGGVEAWRAAGRPVGSYRVAGLEEWCRGSRSGAVPPVLDVRQQVEWERGHVRVSQHIFVGDVPDRLAEVPRGGEVWVVCATGHRASLAASLLDREGIPVRLIDGTGVEDFLAHCPEPEVG